MQQWIVAIIVACAAWVVVQRYLPKAARQALCRQLARVATTLGWRRVARKFAMQTQTSSSCADGCGTCGGCGSKSAPPVEGQVVLMAQISRRKTPQ